MWELDHKEGWALKNWCFWIVVQEKTLKSPLDCKEIKPVSPKVNQPWIFFGKTVTKAEAREFQKNIYFCFIDYAKAFDSVDHSKLWKIQKEMGIPDHLTCLLETFMQVRKQQLELDMKQQTGSK